MTAAKRSAMHRLLRGRMLYVLLGALVAVLYAGIVPVTLPRHHGAAEVSAPDDTLEWWPKTLDAGAVKAALAEQPALGPMLSAIMLLLIGFGAGGALLFAWALATGRLRALWGVTSHRLPPWSFGELGRILLLTVLVASLLPFLSAAWGTDPVSGAADHHLWVTVSMLFLDVFIILLVLAFASEKGPSAWSTLGFSGFSPVAVGLRGYLMAFPWLFLILLLMVKVMQWFHLKPPVESIQELIFQEQRGGVLALVLMLACVIGPVAEELFFRGVVYPAIRQRTSRLAATLLSGAAFSLVHTNLVGFLPIMALGCLLAHLYESTGSLASPLAVHIVHNSLLMSLALVLRKLLFLTQ